MIKNSAIRKLKRSIDKLYDSTCTISRYEKYKDPVTKETKTGPNIKYKDIPCRISKQSLSKNNQNDIFNKVIYEIKLFIAPDIDIKQGDEIEVTKFGLIVRYTAGEPFLYSTHQEVILNKECKA